MKKFLTFIAVIFAAISCSMDGGSYSQSYPFDITFEFSDYVYTNSFSKDSLFVLTEGEGFIYGNYPLFFGEVQATGTFKGGFLMSYLKGEKDGELTKEANDNDAYRVYAEAGQKGSKTYAVFYDNPDQSQMPQYDVEFGYKDVGACTMYGCYVNNTTLVARKVKEHFTDEDRLTLKAIGHKHDGTKVEASIVLAKKDTIMYNWSAFDLSKLGAVDYMDFEVVSTNPAVPAYFCLDGLSGHVAISY